MPMAGDPPARLIALHGFLGRASDWDDLADHFPGAALDSLDLWSIIEDARADDGDAVTAALDRRLAGALRRDDSRPAFLLAYSFGARLALSSDLLAGPAAPVRGCCFVSCHPGLPDDDLVGRAARRDSDEAWARRLEGVREDADAFWRAWDAQPVFAGSRAPARGAGLPASRATLARALRVCTLARQPDFRPRLRGWPMPLLWVTGARDPKFSALARDLQASGVRATFVNCEEAGHRVPWDNPPVFARAVRAWIGRVLETER